MASNKKQIQTKLSEHNKPQAQPPKPPEQPSQDADGSEPKKKNTYASRMAKLPPGERMAARLEHAVKAVDAVKEIIGAWKIDETLDANHATTVKTVTTVLGEARESLTDSIAGLKALGEFKPIGAPRKQGERKAIAVGATVKIAKRSRDEYTAALPGVDLDHITVLATVGRKLRVRLSDGETAFVSRGDVTLAA